MSGKVWKIITAAVGIIVILLSLFIMTFRLGLVDELDFGAGAYYYADIPEFEKYVGDGAFTPAFPLWVYILLFLGWGYLMWRLWIFIDRK